MAKKLVRKSLPPKRPSATSKYPWHEWADGSVWEVKRGEDFEVEPRMFAHAAYQYARRQGMTLDYRVGKTRVHFQFLPGEES